MWPIIILIVIAAVWLVVTITRKLSKSKWFDKVVNDLTETPITDEPKTSEVLKKIGAAEHALKQKSKEQEVEAKKLVEDNKKIGDYLADRGVVKPDKGKES